MHYMLVPTETTDEMDQACLSCGGIDADDALIYPARIWKAMLAAAPTIDLRAKLVARVLSEHGLAVSPPDEGVLDDVEQERWNACVKVVKALFGETD